MKSLTLKNTLNKTLILSLLTAFTMTLTPTTIVSAKHGRDKDKKNEKFINGHDARDGRFDGRGPKHKGYGRRDDGDERDDRDDRDDDDYGRDRNDRRDDRRGRNYGGYNRSDIRNQALNYGYREGYNSGRQDRVNDRNPDYRNDSVYRDATAGYRDQYGNVEFYRQSFREGYQRGYEDGYRGRSSGSGGGWRDIIGGVLGQ